MSIRAVFIGLLLVVVVCGFNDLASSVFRLSSMIQGSMPVIVFATVVLLALLINPAIRAAGALPGALLSRRELAVVLALGVCACGYTGATFMRYLPSLAALSPHVQQRRTAWQSTQAMSFVPGHAGKIAEAQLLDPAGLARRVLAGRGSDTAAGRLWRLTPEADRPVWEAAGAAGEGAVPGAGALPGALPGVRARLTRLVNAVLEDPAFARGVGVDGVRAEAGVAADREPWERLAAGRRWLVAEMPGVFAPPPAGGGVMLNDGAYVPAVTDAILVPSDADLATVAAEVPWGAWWPVLRLWGGLMALLVLAVVCLSVVVRPQWADHERLAFPLVRFVELMTTREEGQGLPTVARSPLFWLGFAVVGMHVLNGLHAWFPALPHIPTRFDLSPLRELFPNASRTWQAGGVFEPRVYLTVVAFAFLLPASVSLTFGIGNVVFVALAGYLTAIGVGVGGAARRGYWIELLNFGAVLAMVGAILYTGRHYYGRVAMNALTPRPAGADAAASPAVVWAFRGLLVLTPLSVLHLTTSGVSPIFAAFGVGMVLVLWLVSARIVCETGLLRYGQIALPMSVATSFLDPQGIGPTNIIVLTAVGVLLVTDLWEAPMTYMITGLQATHRAGVPERRVAPALATTAMIGLVIAVAATLVVQHQAGLLSMHQGVVPQRGTGPVGQAAKMVAEMPTDEVQASLDANWLQTLSSFEFDGWVFGWTAAGLVLFTLCTVARLRVPWWSIHPVLFVLLGNWGLVVFGPSFLLGWLIKRSVLRVGGARGYYAVLPLMCGIIAGGLVSGIGWIVVGMVYYAATGMPPVSYGMF